MERGMGECGLCEILYMYVNCKMIHNMLIMSSNAGRSVKKYQNK